MLDPVQTQTFTPAAQRLFAPWPAFRQSLLVTHHRLNQSPAKQN